MEKVIGIAGLFGGIIWFLYEWVKQQKLHNRRLGELIVFLQKSIFAMEEENIRVIDYLEGYRSPDIKLEETLKEIARRLRQNIYPSGQSVWEAVFWEKKDAWNFSEEIFELILAMGNGFFGRTRSENLCFLRKSLVELESQQKKQKEKDAQERKVWIPVGMLSGIMLMIILI